MSTFKELDVVRTTVEVGAEYGDGSFGKVPIGSLGTVVYVFGGGQAYEVEFDAGISTLTDNCFVMETTYTPATDHSATIPTPVSKDAVSDVTVGEKPLSND